MPTHPISAKRVASAMVMSAHAIYERHKYGNVTESKKVTIIENKQMLKMTRVAK